MALDRVQGVTGATLGLLVALNLAPADDPERLVIDDVGLSYVSSMLYELPEDGSSIDVRGLPEVPIREEYGRRVVEGLSLESGSEYI